MALQGLLQGELAMAPGFRQSPAAQWPGALSGALCTLGLVVEREVDDEGGNHHDFVLATDRGFGLGDHTREPMKPVRRPGPVFLRKRMGT